MSDKRKDVRDPGEREQNAAIERKLTDAPELSEKDLADDPVQDPAEKKCQTCGRDKANS